MVGDEELAELADDTFGANEHSFETSVAERVGEGHGSASGFEVGMLAATGPLPARSMSFAIGVLDLSLAPFGLWMRDNAAVAERRAQRFIDTYRKVLS